MAILTGCTESPGPGRTRTWCDHGNRLYALDTADTQGETLTVAPDDVTCDQDRREVTIRPEGDTRPMPEVTALLGGAYKPYKPTPAPKPGPKVIPPKGTPYRLSPSVR